jgi:hypothetical protein
MRKAAAALLLRSDREFNDSGPEVQPDQGLTQTTYGITGAVADGYFPFRDKLLRLFLGRITEDEGSLVNAEMSLVVS